MKLNQRNPAVMQYLYDVIRFWIDTFDIDGIRLDAADVLDFDFMKGMRHETAQMKEDFWLMGEVSMAITADGSMTRRFIVSQIMNCIKDFIPVTMITIISRSLIRSDV